MLKDKCYNLIGVFFVFMCLYVTPLQCQGDDAPIWDQDGSAPIVKTIDGRVLSVDAQNSLITVKTVETLVFFVPSSANVTNKDGFTIQLSQINPGNYVMVEYYDDKSGKHIARGINVEYSN